MNPWQRILAQIRQIADEGMAGERVAANPWPPRPMTHGSSGDITPIRAISGRKVSVALESEELMEIWR